MTTLLCYLEPSKRILVRRHIDNETLIGELLPSEEQNPILHALLSSSLEPASDLLNHENLVSLHGAHFVVQDLEAEQPDIYLLYDYCDAGNVESLLRKDTTPCKRTTTGFLPESLIWHVTLGVLRALQWLHEGIRDTYTAFDSEDGSGRCKRVRGVQKPTEPWTPVFHTHISSQTILFQKPRGIETYGTVKLAPLEYCQVIGYPYVSGDVKAPVVTVKSNFPATLGQIKEWKSTWDKGIKDENKGELGLQEELSFDQRPFSRGTEIFDLGAVLFEMMTGFPIPGVAGTVFNAKGQECRRCGCNHMTWDDRMMAEGQPWQPCPHSAAECGYRDVNIDEALRRVTDYSPKLCELVAKMLRLKRTEDVLASEVLDAAWGWFTVWAETTPDGVLFRDVFDDLYARVKNQERIDRVHRAAAREIGSEF
ncbi:hypothetical protein QBC47DRAFT_114832 [Echria macrotheca]|uniref:non-specific serine/threonine protein kinase n=1 Tax=Echria macrotheca TaxID=438768 RepID=A0AAJ0BK75_9PEZI|nr:hypothetical protein QBC47DRAFT_114832 [Echria macrotheca]